MATTHVHGTAAEWWPVPGDGPGASEIGAEEATDEFPDGSGCLRTHESVERDDGGLVAVGS